MTIRYIDSEPAVSPYLPCLIVALLSLSPALQHGDGCRSRRVGLRLRGSRPAAQPFPPLRLLADVAGAAGHAWKQHDGHHKRGQQQRKHQQPGVVQQPEGP